MSFFSSEFDRIVLSFFTNKEKEGKWGQHNNLTMKKVI